MNKMRLSFKVPALAVIGLSALSAHALAQEPIGAANFAALTPIETQDLGALRGGAVNIYPEVKNQQELTNLVAANPILAQSVDSGGVHVGDHALDNFSGVGLFILNTGHTNAINGAVGVTVNLY